MTPPPILGRGKQTPIVERGIRLGKPGLAKALIDAWNEESWESVLDIAYELDPSQFEDAGDEE